MHTIKYTHIQTITQTKVSAFYDEFGLFMDDDPIEYNSKYSELLIMCYIEDVSIKTTPLMHDQYLSEFCFKCNGNYYSWVIFL